MWLQLVPLATIVAFSAAKEGCYNKELDCFYYGKSECNGAYAYNGTRSHTVRGILCQRWDGKEPHSPVYTTAPENYCRNPSASEYGPWCYTTDPDKRFDNCFTDCDTLDCYDDAEKCYHYGKSKCSTKNVYNGTWSYTINGILCEKWENSKFKTEAENYCRNPDKSIGPWCYTTNPSISYQNCFAECSDCLDKEHNCFHFGKPRCDQPYIYNGTRQHTKDGILCQEWALDNPHSHIFNDLPKNYCRNPATGTGPWCYTTDKDKKWSYCFTDCAEVTTTSAKETTTEPATSTTAGTVSTSSGPGCYNKELDCFSYGKSECNGIYAYNGTRSHTVRGILCQRWDAKEPHSPVYTAAPENYCRNPSASEYGPWCYTTDPNKRFDNCFTDCDILDCYDDAEKCYHYGKSKCNAKNVYNGTWSYTINGILCEKWDNTKYNTEAENYCRNPDKSIGPWCYTTNPSISYQHCFAECSDCLDKERNCFYYGKPRCDQPYIYNGTRQHTKEGIVCQEWALDSPHSHIFTDLPNNYCRNPATGTGPWCYTTDKDKKWGYCFSDCAEVTATSVKETTTEHATPTTVGTVSTSSGPELGCYDDKKECYNYGKSICNKQNVYTGTRNITKSGIPCQRWKANWPHNSYHETLPENYCRIPNGDGPWCYTMDPNKRWEHCFSDCEDVTTTLPVQAETEPGPSTTQGTASSSEAPDKCLDKPVNLLVFMDGSGSTGLLDFEKKKLLAANVVKKLPANSRVSVLQFSHSSVWELKFDNGTTLDSDQGIISAATYLNQSTDTAKGLKAAYEEIQKHHASSVTMLTITSGHDKEWEANEGPKYAKMILDAGVKSYAVAIGDGVDMMQLNEFVGSTDHIVTADKFSELDDQLAKRTVGMICATDSGGSSKEDSKMQFILKKLYNYRT